MKKNIRDPWALLGLDRSASDQDIKAAYRKLALTCHPDRAQDPESAERFTDISVAYQSISTSEKRSAWLASNEPVSEETYKKQSSAPPPERVIEISFAESFSGAQKEIEIEIEDICSNCGGSGAAPGFKPIPCDTCQGTGNHRLGSSQNICQACQGKGFLIEKACSRCQDGLVLEVRPFIFQIPAGVTQGYKVQLNGQRRGCLSSAPVSISVLIEESPVFQRNLNDPADLMIDVPVSYPEAVLGSSVKIPTPTHVISLKIPAGTKSGKVFRIKGEGMPQLGKEERGNLYARVLVDVPEKPEREELDMIASLQKFQPKNIRYHLFDN